MVNFAIGSPGMSRIPMDQVNGELINDIAAPLELNISGPEGDPGRDSPMKQFFGMSPHKKEILLATQKHTLNQKKTTTVGRPVHARPTWFVIFAESEVWLVEQEVS